MENKLLLPEVKMTLFLWCFVAVLNSERVQTPYMPPLLYERQFNVILVAVCLETHCSITFCLTGC